MSTGQPIRRNESDEQLYFISTQMQARHEETVDQENQQHFTNSKLEFLRSFKNEDELITILESITPSPIPAKPKSKSSSKPKTPRLKAAKSTKNQSMNSLVRNHYTDRLSYFSGDQRKIDDFLKGIKNTRDLSKINKTSLLLYTRGEWTYILRNIKMKFPDLSSGRKMNLKAITSKINGMKEADTGNSLWEKASRSCSMTEEDFRWLYDLSDEQMNGTFVEEEYCEDSQDDRRYVLTLSQNMEQIDHPFDEESEYEEVEATDDDELLVLDEMDVLRCKVDQDQDSDVILDSEFENDILLRFSPN
ncbi:uncharacterized protein CANTADRAFT_26505 [Suhomyces tanzawaensis NRRL Y-17324]|uniref:Uncharacterized protein n=1 Tax=Suhomyces tanzawaensis NRRL Y-17324 TaxID=984487 RepID=A0A1E4SFT9_9ASCO|nr:uncharacterized protein CANTADRAFT_26505 [Suhomyces tanzawaensis NRRL Y-17324]ODV78378.1 hypothetical protein CANTADRAFT_26505 [Suhomyces tanzawaensis NRRL Y-17324]